MVVMGSLKVLSHLENTRLLVIITLRRSQRSARDVNSTSSAGFAQQRLDHMPVINHRLPAGRARDVRNLLGPVVNLQVLLVNPRLRPAADEPGRD